MSQYDKSIKAIFSDMTEDLVRLMTGSSVKNKEELLPHVAYKELHLIPFLTRKLPKVAYKITLTPVRNNI